jgi:hypothetical protein
VTPLETAAIQAAAATWSAVAAVVGAGVAIVALVVAWQARGVAVAANRIAEQARDIAADARDAEAAQADLADKALREARRQTILASVPSIHAHRPVLVSREHGRVGVAVENDGPGNAYSVMVKIAPAAERSVDATVEGLDRWSGRKAALPPREPETISVMAKDLLTPDGRWTYEWLVVALEFASQLGARATFTYVWSTEPRQEALWRLHRVQIDPQDGGEPVRFDLSLGPDADEPDRATPFVG